MSVEDDALTPFLLEEAGDDLRSVGFADGETKHITHLRDDVAMALAEAGATDDRVEQIADELVYRELERGYQEALFTLGDRRGSIEMFGGGYALLLPWDAAERRGALATFDRPFSFAVPAFFDECYRRLPWSDGGPSPE